MILYRYNSIPPLPQSSLQVYHEHQYELIKTLFLRLDLFLDHIIRGSVALKSVNWVNESTVGHIIRVLSLLGVCSYLPQCYITNLSGCSILLLTTELYYFITSHTEPTSSSKDATDIR